MPTVIRCPSCERRLRVPENVLGKTIRCPACKKTFTAHTDDEPEDEEEEEEEEEAPRPARRKPAPPAPKKKAPEPPPSPLGAAQPGDSDIAYQFQPAPPEIDQKKNEAVEMRRKRLRQEKQKQARVQAKVQGPATALLAFGGLTLAMGILGLLFNVLTTVGVISLTSGGQAQAQGQGESSGWGFMIFILQMLVPAIFLAWGGFTIRAARKMKELEEYAIARKWAIIAMLPFNLCWFVGLPIGIWVLSVLNDKEVRTIFTKPLRADDSLYR
jgi:hypothetical protein